MRKWILLFGFLAVLFAIFAVLGNRGRQIVKPVMKITSSAFANNAKIPATYTCDGQNISPPLSFSQIPQDAKSLVLIMDDPDAPTGTFVHWILYNMDPTVRRIVENSSPSSAVQGLTNTGKTGYVGACPPSGTHRYFFKLYALNTILNIVNLNKSEVEGRMQGHVIEKAELIGLYSR